MPTYDYQCRACGAITEVIHSMLEDGPSVCEECGGALRRVLYPTGIIFKGSGFYTTDSRSSTAGSGTSSTAAATSKSGDGSSSSAASSPTTPSSSSGSEGTAGTKSTPTKDAATS